MILGTSQSDVLRRIRRGELQAESIQRPGGTMLRVLIEPRQDAPGATSEPRQAQEQGHATATSESTLVAVQGLSDALVAERTERQRLAEENADLRERVGRAEAASEAHQTRANLEAQRADLEKQRADQAEAENTRLKGRSLWDRIRNR